MPTKHILILGGGPAGTATAIGLKRIGYQVSIIQSPRTFAACEGISKRTLEGLHTAGCFQAAATAAPPCPKFASWNGESNSFNSEHLVSRQEFDAKLNDDLHTAGITPIFGVIQSVDEVKGKDHQWRAIYRDKESLTRTITADYLVEARGRSGALKCEDKIRGPETVSLLQRWRIENSGNAASMAASYRHGWAWLAKLDSELYTQVTVSAHDARIPKKTGLRQFILDELKQIPETAQWLESATPIGDPVARGCTCILAGEPVNERLLRVGDAAVAADPLSGNGIFAALSAALAAPAVINTILQHPQRAELAMRFYRGKCRETFLRFCRTGRDFYAMEQRWQEQPFWRERSRWPDTVPLHKEFDPRKTAIRKRPVVERDQIMSREVLITPDQPLGIWQVAGIELAPILKELEKQPNPSEDWIKARLLEQDCPQPQRAAMLGWLNEHRLI